MEGQLHRRTVVVGVDGSDHALRAVRWGAAEAERSRTPLRLITAFGLLIDHVVVVRGAEQPTPDADASPVVVGVGGSGNDDAALEFAFEAAAARHAPLVAVQARLDLMIDATARTADPYELEAHDRARLAARLAGWVQKYPELVVEPVVASGAPTRILLEQASRAQLLVIGSRGHRPFGGVILGSVSHAVLHRAPCAVAVVRPDPDAGESGAP